MKMKNKIGRTGLGCVLLLTLLFSSSAVLADQPKAKFACDAPASWVKIESREGKFSAFSPGKMRKQTKTIPTAVGPIKIIMHVKGSRYAAYFIAYSDYPAKMVQAVRADKLLERGARSGLKRIPDSKLIKSSSFTYKGFAARGMLARGKVKGTPMTMRAVYIMAENRLYQVLSLYANVIKKSDESAKRFVKCFDLKLRAKAKAEAKGKAEGKAEAEAKAEAE